MLNIRNYSNLKITIGDPFCFRSSSSCHAAGADLPDPLLPPVSIVHRSREVFQLHPDRHRAVLAGRPAFAHPCEGVHRSTSLMSSSLLLQQCPACLTLIVFVMDGRWPYSCCFVGCYLQDLFNTASNIHVYFQTNFFSIRLVSVYVVHPYLLYGCTT